MEEVSQESQFTAQHKGFIKVPVKVLRCIGLSPYEKGSGDKGKYYKFKQGNRTLHELFYRLACRQIGTKRGVKNQTIPFTTYYKQKLAAEENQDSGSYLHNEKVVMWYLLSMKNKSEYVKPTIHYRQAG